MDRWSRETLERVGTFAVLGGWLVATIASVLLLGIVPGLLVGGWGFPLLVGLVHLAVAPPFGTAAADGEAPATIDLTREAAEPVTDVALVAS